MRRSNIRPTGADNLPVTKLADFVRVACWGASIAYAAGCKRLGRHY